MSHTRVEGLGTLLSRGVPAKALRRSSLFRFDGRKIWRQVQTHGRSRAGEFLVRDQKTPHHVGCQTKPPATGEHQLSTWLLQKPIRHAVYCIATATVNRFAARLPLSRRCWGWPGSGRKTAFLEKWTSGLKCAGRALFRYVHFTTTRFMPHLLHSFMETFDRTMNVLQLVIEPLNPPAEMDPATIPTIDGRPLTELIGPKTLALLTVAFAAKNRLLAIGLVLAATSMVSLVHAQQAPSRTVTFTTLINFDGTNGGNSAGPLVQGPDGDLYGTTFAGGRQWKRHLLQDHARRHSDHAVQFLLQTNCADGNSPTGALTLGTDGNFYGITLSGGTTGSGIAFNYAQRYADHFGTIEETLGSGTSHV